MNLLTYQPSVRTIARNQKIDIATLLQILSLRRPDESKTEAEFCVDYLDPIEGMQCDDFGNRYLIIGDNPNVMWSCHTDTVSDEGGNQNVKWRGDILELNEPKQGQSLGADDGAGLWLMLEMIKAERPGLYIFHRAEEVGGIGSKHIAKNNPDFVKNIDIAIAFDRKSTSSVITFQRGQRCCSDAFGNALAAKLNQTEGLDYRLDRGGVFTDTASYTDLISECTNLSAGYYNEHTSRETLDVAHLLRLREALLSLDTSDLPVERDPSRHESSYGYGYGYGYGGYSGYGQNNFRKTETEEDRILRLVRSYPRATAGWVRKMGLTADVFDQLLNGGIRSARDAAEVFLQEEALELRDEVIAADALHCLACERTMTEEDLFSCPQDGEECPWCLSINTEVVEVYINADTGELVDA